MHFMPRTGWQSARLATRVRSGAAPDACVSDLGHASAASAWPWVGPAHLFLSNPPWDFWAPNEDSSPFPCLWAGGWGFDPTGCSSTAISGGWAGFPQGPCCYGCLAAVLLLWCNSFPQWISLSGVLYSHSRAGFWTSCSQDPFILLKSPC